MILNETKQNRLDFESFKCEILYCNIVNIVGYCTTN